MPVFISDEEFAAVLAAGDVTAVAEKADAFIQTLNSDIEMTKAKADAASITAEQTCSILEQKYISLSSEFSAVESRNLQLDSDLQQRSSELAQVQSEKHQLYLKFIEKDGEIERLKTEVSEVQKSKRQLLELLGVKDAEINDKNSTIKSYVDKISDLTDRASKREARVSEIEAQVAKEKTPTAPPSKKAKTGTDLTHGSDLAGSLGNPDDRLSDLSVNVDTGALCEYFSEPRPTSAAVTQAEAGKQPTPRGGKGVVAISSSKGDQVPRLSKGADVDNAKLKDVGMTLAGRLQEWVEVAVSRLQEQEARLGQGTSAARELAAAKEEAEKAKQSAAAEHRCRLAADQKAKAATDKAVELAHEVTTLKGEMAKLEAEKALVEKERDKQAAGHKIMGEKMLSWKSSYEVVARKERQTKAELAEAQAALAHREGDIHRLMTVTIPSMCAMYRDQIEEAIREAIKRVAAEGFPWDAFEGVLDDLVAAQEEKLLAEAAKKAKEAEEEKARAAKEAEAAEDVAALTSEQPSKSTAAPAVEKRVA